MCFLSAAEVERLAEAIPLPYGLLVRFAAYTGLRAGELAALRVKRLDLLRGTVRVVESASEIGGRLVLGSTKTYAERTLRLPRFLRDDLAAYLAGRPRDPDGYVFTAPKGGPLRHNNFYQRIFCPALARAGLPAQVRFHDLRHTCAALLIAQGAHPKAIQVHLGHSSIQVTMDRYGHLFPRRPGAARRPPGSGSGGGSDGPSTDRAADYGGGAARASGRRWGLSCGDSVG
jgi:integrase